LDKEQPIKFCKSSPSGARMRNF